MKYLTKVSHDETQKAYGSRPPAPLGPRILGTAGHHRRARPYKFIGFGAMDATKPYEFIGFVAMGATKPYKFIEFAGPFQLSRVAVHW